MRRPLDIVLVIAGLVGGLFAFPPVASFAAFLVTDEWVSVGQISILGVRAILAMAWPANVLALGLFVGAIHLLFVPNGLKTAAEAMETGALRVRLALLALAVSAGLVVRACIELPTLYVVPVITFAVIALGLALTDFFVSRSPGWSQFRAWLGYGLWGKFAMVVAAAAIDMIVYSAAAGEWGYLPPMIVIGGLIAAVLAADLVFSRSRIWAVARYMIAESIRTKVAILFIALVLLVLTLTPFAAGDGLTLKSRVQSFLAYSLGLVGFLLSFLTVFLACGSVANDIRDRHVYMILTKPIARWQFFVGKWIGIGVLNGLLLAITAAAVLGFTGYLERQPTDVPGDAEALQYEVLSVRHGYPVEEPDWGVLVDDRVRQYKESGTWEELAGEDEARRRELIRAELEQQWRLLRPGETREFVFNDLLVDRDHEILFELPASLEEELDGGRVSRAVREFFDDQGTPLSDEATLQPEIRQRRWVIMDGPRRFSIRREDDVLNVYEEGFVHLHIKPSHSGGAADVTFAAGWDAGDPDELNTRTAFETGEFIVDRYHTIPIPTYAVNKEGTLYVRFTNLSRRDAIRFEEEQSIELLTEIGTFPWNLVRALAIIWCRLAFVAAVGVLASAFVSFPVACMVGMVVLVTSLLSGWLGDAVGWMEPDPTGEDPLWIFGPILRAITRTFVWLVPDFSRYDAVANVVNGKLVPLMWVLNSMVTLVLIKSVLLGLLGCLILTKREVARVTV